MFPRKVITLLTCVTTAVGAGVLIASGSSAAEAGQPAHPSTGQVWATVSVGATHTCGIRRDQTLWCWGYNISGQLGLGDGTDRDVPTRVGVDADWARVTTGGSHTCGTRTNHALWCWGWNARGQLGLGDTRTRWAPKRV